MFSSQESIFGTNTYDIETIPEVLQNIPEPDADDTLKIIHLTGNIISEIEDGAFSKLINLEELYLAENKLTRLPLLPSKLITLNANFNLLKTKGVRANAFKNNNINTITDETFCKGNTTKYIRSTMVEVRLDGNPLVLAQHPNSFICLWNLPSGNYH
ncbi:Mimecan [Merluccius polli]|uniref:Mimecan n=1 Tax=Merluccius polli TaxID=89951 RepID=A0AA47NBG2_MERPO|nr:Mimecan [Merluccius polli]